MKKPSALKKFFVLPLGLLAACGAPAVTVNSPKAVPALAFRDQSCFTAGPELSPRNPDLFAPAQINRWLAESKHAQASDPRYDTQFQAIVSSLKLAVNQAPGVISPELKTLLLRYSDDMWNRLTDCGPSTAPQIAELRKLEDALVD